MISDKLYELALEYKKTKLWKNLWETELFAVKLSGGRIGYICIMGSAGEHIALSLHIGEDAFLSLRRLSMLDDLELTPLKIHEVSLQQDCMQCSLENKHNLEQREYEEARAYFSKNGIRPSGKNSYPMFRKYKPGRFPWPLQAQEDQEDLCEALAAAIELSKRMKGKRKAALGLRPLEDDLEEIPLMEYRDGGYVLEKTPLPVERPIEPPEPIFSNDIALANLKKLKRVGVWECEIIYCTEPVQDEPDEVPFFPVAVMAVKSSDGYVLPMPMVKDYEENPKELLNQFVDELLAEELCPVRIKARDARTYAFAKSLCEKLNIKLELEEDLPALDEAQDNLMEYFNSPVEDLMDEDFSNLLHDILDGRENGSDVLPDGLLDYINKDLRRLGISPENLFNPEDTEASWDDRPRQMAPPQYIGPEQSFVISVSLGTNCYRHIQISGDSTLFILHCAILDAFDFFNDHAHAFFMDNVFWSEWDSYYASGIDGERSTDDYTLNQVGLSKGKQFKYIFDFGDEWRFQCKVLKVLEGDTPETMIIKSKGDAPEQYPSWDGDDDF